MKITMYELLGMIKDGKQPNHIVFDTDDWYWGYDSYIQHNFLNQTPDVQTSVSLFHRYRIDYCLKDEVEIIEEEKKIPEKLKIEQDTPSSNYYIRNEYGTKCGLTKHSKMIAETLNEVIDYLDYLKSKGE